MHNMVCSPLGPVSNRPGLEFIYDLNSLGLDPEAPFPAREIPFIFNEVQTYAMVFFMHTDGQARLIFGNTNSEGVSGLVVGSGIPVDFSPNWTMAYTGVGDYAVLFSEGTVTANHVSHLSDEDVLTVLTETTDYTVIITSTTATFTVTEGTITGGVLKISIDLTADAIPLGEVIMLAFPLAWSIKDFDWAQSADEMHISQSGLNPHIIQRYHHEHWQLVSQTFANSPDDWSDEYGWPERVTFHQQRLIFAANTLKRQTGWASTAGNFNNFGRFDGGSGALTADSAITFTLDSGTQNKIQWISSGKLLHIGTMGIEWTVQGNNRESLTPTNLLAQGQTNHGSEPNKVLSIGSATLFIERHGRTVNEFVYDYNFDSYTTSNMAVLASHLTEQYSIQDWTYQQTPDSIIWCIREDGVLLGVTYQRQHKVVGWHQHSTQGSFEAITCIPGNTREDDVWIIVKRLIGGEVKYYLEKMANWFIGENPREGRFLDSYRFIEINPPETSPTVKTVTGLDHLEGLKVNILADGTVHSPQMVINGGIELDDFYTEIVVGLQYISEVWPLLNVIPDNLGTSFGRVQRVKELIIDFYKTLGVYIGRFDSEDGEQEEEIAFRIPSDLTGVQVPLYTGLYHWSYHEGFDREITYFIRQKQPLPVTVRGITDVLEILE